MAPTAMAELNYAPHQAADRAGTATARKKFATPPVKIACLACRASRTRCDGGSPCASCSSKDRECIYKPSRRGGPRYRKRKPQGTVTNIDLPGQLRVQTKLEEVDGFSLAPGIASMPQTALDVHNYIDPGAGLRVLGDFAEDSDLIFDSLFSPVDDRHFGASRPVDLGSSEPTVQQHVPMVRTYRSDHALLEAYYIWIHPFFPILPPPNSPAALVDNPTPLFKDIPAGPDGTNDFEPSTPLTYAISAILAQIPCSQDTDHVSEESILFRRNYSKFLAQAAVERIDAEAEMTESDIEPSKALDRTPDSPPPATRAPFHPRLPVELESIIALDLLSVYEYAQRGNLKKQSSRAGQALMAAMELNLHLRSDVEDDFSEARQRVWWMTFVSISQYAIVSNTKPGFIAFSRGFQAKIPTLPIDPEAFSIFIQSQHAILTATQFVIELNKAVAANASMEPIYQKMCELEASIGPMIARSETWVLNGTPNTPVTPAEEVLSRSLRCMAKIKLNSARIKLHRYCAFFDQPVFSGKHCDLKGTTQPPSPDSQAEPRKWPTCCSSSFTQLPTSATSSSVYSTPGSDDTPVHPQPPPGPPPPTSLTFPFSSHQSANICLRSALNIADAFENLPYPCPFPEGSAAAAAVAAATAATAANDLFGGGSGAVAGAGAGTAAGAAAAAAGGGGGGGGEGLLNFGYPSPTTMLPGFPPTTPGNGMAYPSPPRTMPGFACCAMQGCYTLLMTHRKTRHLYAAAVVAESARGQPEGGGGGAMVAGVMMARLRRGLAAILGALENYATAFEALGGMRDQIRMAVESNHLF